MRMGRSYHARVDERVEPLNGDLGTSKAKVIETLRELGAGRSREEECRPDHGGSTVVGEPTKLLTLELGKWGRGRRMMA